MTCLPVECAAQTGKSLQRMSSADEDSSLAIDVLLICSNPYHLAGQPMLQACLGQTCKSLRAAISQPGYGRACLEHFADASPWVAFAVERNLLGRPSLENIQSWISVQQQLTFEACPEGSDDRLSCATTEADDHDMELEWFPSFEEVEITDTTDSGEDFMNSPRRWLSPAGNTGPCAFAKLDLPGVAKAKSVFGGLASCMGWCSRLVYCIVYL